MRIRRIVGVLIGLLVFAGTATDTQAATPAVAPANPLWHETKAEKLSAGHDLAENAGPARTEQHGAAPTDRDAVVRGAALDQLAAAETNGGAVQAGPRRATERKPDQCA